MAVLVGKKAPGFNAQAVINGKDIVDGFALSQYLGKQYVLLFFYPKDFTFVCPTELHAFQDKLGEFEARNCAVVGVSTDTAETHQAYLRVAKDQGGIQGVTYPLVADTNKTISTNYDVLAGEFVEHEREAWILLLGRSVPYPFQYNIHRLPEAVRDECLAGLRQATANAADAPLPTNFGEWIDATFGVGKAEIDIHATGDFVGDFAIDAGALQGMHGGTHTLDATIGIDEGTILLQKGRAWQDNVGQLGRWIHEDFLHDEEI